MLPIAGIQKLSLVNYPEKLCAVLFLQGCNLRCPYCHNASLIPCEWEGSGVYLERWEQVFDYLERRRLFLEGVCITGGEPTIHSELPNIIHEIKQMGYQVKLDTNGTNPGMIEILLREGQLDYIAMDIKTSFGKYYLLGANDSIVDKIKSSIELIVSLSGDYEFRTTAVPGLVEESDIISIAQVIKGAKRYVLQAYRCEYVFDPEKSPAGALPPNKIRRFLDMLSGYVEEVLVRGYGDLTTDYAVPI